MMGGQYIFVIAAVFFASCDCHLEPYEIERLSFDSNKARNVIVMKEIGVYDEFGAKFTDIYSLMNTCADQIYNKGDELLKNVVDLYNEYQKTFDDYHEKINKSVDDDQLLSQINSTYERIEEYEEILEDDSLSEKNKTVINKLLRQNYDLNDKMEKNRDKYLDALYKLDSTLNDKQETSVSEREIKKMIESKIEYLESKMNAACTLFMKHTKQIVENFEYYKELEIDEETIREVGNLKIDNFERSINFKCEEILVRKVSRMNRQLEIQFQARVGFLEQLKDKEANIFTDVTIGAKLSKARIQQNFNTIDDYLGRPHKTF